MNGLVWTKRKKFFYLRGVASERQRLSGLALLEDIGEVALAAVLAVLVPAHEDTSATGGVGALTAETSDLARLIDLVVLEDRQLDFLALVLDLLGRGVGLLLLLLTTTKQLSVQVEGVQVLDTVERELAVNEVLASERQQLGISGDA